MVEASTGIKVVYFNLHARVEFIRVLLAHANVEYTNEIVELPPSTAWPTLKASGKLAFNSLPEVTVDGIVMNQSRAAGRALAIKYGYYSTDPRTMWAIDSLVDFIQADFDKITFYGFTPVDKRTEEKNEKWRN